ncbi:hypothetical protein BBK82_44380 [Lentzea guizhouensis]|uniref:Uncharacterized protein n=1 Tax=Lentzea guizhouensis TaxID=1586287 RepID=A0A1B2HW47_9PSEU|nr:hypothetical protein [Lentzea guizhouensis]ANZ41933.1 hypothetical protein BBK82_44380 [Lentzea guizhouensis]
MDHLLTAEHPLVILVLKGVDRARDQTSVHALLDDLASIARWHLLSGRRFLCLVETDDTEFSTPTPGGEQPSWNRHEWLLRHRNGERVLPWITPAS